MDSSSTVAKRYGDIACEMGAVGTGNGRTVDLCGQKVEEKPWYQKYGTEMVVGGVALATLFAVSRYDLPLTLRATEKTYELGTSKRIGNHTVGVTYSENRSMATYRFDW